MRENPIEELQAMAFRAFQSWRFPRARRLARRVILLDDSRSYPHYLLGEIDRRQHRWDAAYDHFVAAADSGRSDARTFYRVGEAAYHSGRLDEAREAMHASEAVAKQAGDATAARRAAEFAAFLER